MYKCIKRGSIKIDGVLIVFKPGDDVTKMVEALDDGVVDSLEKDRFIKDAKKEMAEAKAAQAEQNEMLEEVKKKQAARLKVKEAAKKKAEAKAEAKK